MRYKWHAGTNLVSDKYYFFDMGPYVENKSAFFAVGIGPKNLENIIGIAHYDPSSNDYMPELKTNDLSVQISGTDPYDSP
jgi:hypothetical protein